MGWKGKTTNYYVNTLSTDLRLSFVILYYNEHYSENEKIQFEIYLIFE